MKGTMKSAVRFAALRAIRTMIQGFAGLAAAIPAVHTAVDARTAANVALWGAVGVGVSGVAAFLQNLSERLEATAE
jgi:Zn-dependent alcohol dehydrogenase